MQPNFIHRNSYTKTQISPSIKTKANATRFFADIPKVPGKKKESMAIYLLFIQHIIHSFNAKEAVDDFSVAVSYGDIAAKNHSLSAGQYFEVKIEYVDITPEAFQAKLAGHQTRLQSLFQESKTLETEIESHLGKLQLQPEMENR